MSFGEKLAKYLKDNKMDQKELAKLLGVKEQTISTYITGKNNPTYARFMQICSQLKIDANYFMDSYDKNTKAASKLNPEDQYIIDHYKSLAPHDKEIVDFILEIDEHNDQIDSVDLEPTIIYRFPKYEQQAAAGVGQLGRDSNYRMEEYIANNIPDEAVYAMEIAGESMNHEDTCNLIHTGSIVLINPRFIESELDNKIVIANFKGQIICKRYIDKGEYILFQSDNDKFKSENRKSSDDPDCKVLGIVLGVIDDNKFIKVR